MTYIEDVARRIKAQIASDDLPDGDVSALFLIYGVLALTKGEEVTRRDVHNAWAAWMAQQDPSHESIQPYEDLPPETKREDDPFVAAIRTVAREIPPDA